jgi:hypothetical protein
MGSGCFVRGSLDSSISLSTLAVSPSTQVADGSSASIITVKLLSNEGAPIVGAPIVLSSSAGNVTFVQPGLSDASGSATGSLSSSVVGTQIITASVVQGASRLAVPQTA